MIKTYFFNFFGVTLLFFVVGCGSSQHSFDAGYTAPSDNGQPDYSNFYYWAAHPYKKDPSDSTPAPYRNFVPDTTVDVFFIYPTTYTTDTAVNATLLADPAEQAHWNASVNNAALNAKTDYSTILMQASAFNKYRVFSPRYRQAHIRSFFIADSLSKPFFDTAYTDVKNAFRYYLAHCNQGRPFIIASHSQGAVHAMRLIKDTIENTLLNKQLVAAYLLGIPLRQGYFAQCQPCLTAKQTGCFVSWRTFKKGYTPETVANEPYKVWVINPLTWKTDSLLAERPLNKGAVLFKFNKRSKGVSAQVAGNILWASKPHFLGSVFFTKKNYHIGDINLFWKNVRDNVDDRVQAFKSAPHNAKR